MSDFEQLERARRRMMRYHILKVLDAGRPYPVGDGLLIQVLTDADLPATQVEIRKALQYLCDKGYCVVADQGSHWEARLLPQGIDYLENGDMEDPGIARPARI